LVEFTTSFFAASTAEGQLDRVGLVLVAQRRRGAVRIEVLHLVDVDAGILQRIDHAAARTVGIRRGHVEGVAAHAEAGNLGVDLCAARAWRARIPRAP
jgi:hypothetical protein